MFTQKEFAAKVMDLWIYLVKSGKDSDQILTDIEDFEFKFGWLVNNFVYEHDWSEPESNFCAIDTEGEVREYKLPPIRYGGGYIAQENDSYTYVSKICVYGIRELPLLIKRQP